MSRKNNTMALLVVVVMILSLGLAACRSQPNELRIGILATLSEGDVEVSGIPTVNAARLMADEVNAAGGLEIAGRRYMITLVVEDNGATPEMAVAAASQLINQENVIALIGPQYSSQAIPVAHIAEQARVPMISPISTNPQTTLDKRYVFRAGFLDDFQGLALAQFALSELGAQRAAVLYNVADPYSREIAEVFRQVFENAGGVVTAFESYITGETDFTPHLTRIQTQGCDVLFFPNFSDDVLLQAQQAREMGMTTPFLGSDGWEPMALVSVPEVQGAFTSRHWHSASTTPASIEFVAAYREAYNLPIEDVNDTAALTYDSLGMMLQAIQEAGSTDADAIRDALAYMQYEGVTGTIQFAGTGDPIKSAVITQYMDGVEVFYSVVNP